MNANELRWLDDARRYAVVLNELAAARSQDELETDLPFSLAVERCLEIIGEALRRVRDNNDQLGTLLPEADQWIAMRNVVSHLYDVLDTDIIWRAATIEAQELIESIEQVIDQQG